MTLYELIVPAMLLAWSWGYVLGKKDTLEDFQKRKDTPS